MTIKYKAVDLEALERTWQSAFEDPMTIEAGNLYEAMPSLLAELREHRQARGAQQEPVAYRFTENRGNGKTEYSYYDAERAKFAYRDNCLEITPLFASPPAQPDAVPREPTPELRDAVMLLSKIIAYPNSREKNIEAARDWIQKSRLTSPLRDDAAQ